MNFTNLDPKLLLSGLTLIGKLVEDVSAQAALRTLQAVQRVYDILRGVEDGQVTSEEALAQLDAFETDLDENDAAADAALDDKFGA